MKLNKKLFAKGSDGSLTAEISTLNIQQAPNVVELNGQTFTFTRADKDPSGEDTYGWHYQDENGNRLLIIND